MNFRPQPFLFSTGKKYHPMKSISFKLFNTLFLLIAVCNLLTINLLSQPSGGPYGPLNISYEIPDNAGTIYYVAPDGNSENPGTLVNNPTTIETAITKVVSGDAIILRGGTYRTGNLILNQGIIMQPYKDEKPVLKGTNIAKDWKKTDDNLWVTSWETLFPEKPQSWWNREKNEKLTPLYRFNDDMVFIDGEFLLAVGSKKEVTENTYYIDYAKNEVFIGINPKDHLIEITSHNLCLHRITGNCHGKISDKRGPVIRGITITQYAYRAIEIDGNEPQGISPESEHGKDVVGTTFENCEISYCSRVAAYLRGDSLTMRQCKISNTSTEGIYLICSSDVLFEKNIFTKNNIEKITGYFPAAVKIFNQSYRVTCRDNLIIDHPYSNGVWYDVGNVDGRFINNWVEGVGNYQTDISYDKLWPSDNGFFFEISKGAVCAGNVFVNCDHGLMALNSSDVEIYQNTFINSMACIGRNGRIAEGDHFGWHPSAGPDVDKRNGHVLINNILTGDKNFKRPLLFVWQEKTMCNRLNDSQLSEMDYNQYIRHSISTKEPLILWGPAQNINCMLKVNSVKDLSDENNQEISKHSQSYIDANIPVFLNPDEGKYQLSGEFPGVNGGTTIPDNIIKLLGVPEPVIPYLGAYPQ